LERSKILILSAILAAGYLVTNMISAPPILSGLSTVLGTTVLGSSASVFTSLASLQLYASLALIGLLIFSELTDPTYGGMRHFLVELRTSWLPYIVLLLTIFSLIVAFKVATILSAI